MKFKKSIAGIVLSLLVPACFITAQTAPSTVKSYLENKIVVVNLHDGDSLFPKLTEAIKKHNIKSGLILAATGRLRNFSLSFYELTLRRDYKKTYSGPYSFTNTQGYITQASNGSLHIDMVSLCDSTNSDLRFSDVTTVAIGGQLSGGIVSGTANVFVIMKLDEITFKSEYHPENGTWDTDIKLAGTLGKETGGTGVIKRLDYRKAANGQTTLLKAASNTQVFDVSGRRITGVQIDRLKKMASGMYVVPQQGGKAGTVIKK